MCSNLPKTFPATARERRADAQLSFLAAAVGSRSDSLPEYTHQPTVNGGVQGYRLLPREKLCTSAPLPATVPLSDDCGCETQGAPFKVVIHKSRKGTKKLRVTVTSYGWPLASGAHSLKNIENKQMFMPRRRGLWSGGTRATLTYGSTGL